MAGFSFTIFIVFFSGLGKCAIFFCIYFMRLECLLWNGKCSLIILWLSLYMSIETTDFMYDMTHPKRGVFIIINNKTFQQETRMAERKGTDVDATQLYTTFQALDFNVNVYSDLKAEDMLKVMIEGELSISSLGGGEMVTRLCGAVYYFQWRVPKCL